MAQTRNKGFAAVAPEDPTFLLLENEALATVILWQKMAGTHEVCGFCCQDEHGTQHLLQLTNHAISPGEFETSRSDEQLLQEIARQRRWRVIAFFHTHPDDPPELSPRDRRFFEADIMPWIVVGTPATNACQRTYY